MFAPLEHTLNILRHDLAHALDLALSRAQRILLAGLGAALLEHKALERSIEARAAIRGQVVEVCAVRVELSEEALLERGEEAKGDALAQLALGDDEEGKAAGGGLAAGEVRGRLDEAVDEELGLVDGLVCGFVVRDAREDERDER